MSATPACRIACLFAAVSLAVSFVGCGSLRIPAFQAPGSKGLYVPVGEGVTLAGSESATVYQKVRQAKLENAVVLEVVGDDEPLRVLPLPPGQQSVFVSTLLQQTGVISKLGAIDATVYRHSTDSVAGIRMDVTTNDQGDQIRPESDYALRGGDRIQVREKSLSIMSSNLVTTLLGI